MTESALTLTVLVPGGWDVVPDGLAELRRYLSDECRASLEVQQSNSLLPRPIGLYAGPWPVGMDEEIRQRIDRAFFSLAWVAIEGLG